MTSAFLSPRQVTTASGQRTPFSTCVAMESETEDEEIKRSCVRESPAYDTEYTEDSDSDLSIEDDSSSRDSREGLVTFAKERVPSVLLIRPKAERSPVRPGSLASASTSESGSISSAKGGARGKSLKLYSESSMSASSLEQDETSVGDSSLSSEDMSEQDAFESAENDEVYDSQTEENYSMQDLELSSILSNAGDSDSLSGSESWDERFIGAMEDRSAADVTNIPKPKRVLSFNTLVSLNLEAGRGDEVISKRARTCSESLPDMLPPLGLGEHVQPRLFLLPRVMSLAKIREASPVISTSSDDDDDLDGQLREELCVVLQSRDNTPVPLLTPPQSPLMVEIEGDATTVCEWPSNLAVDSAMANVSAVRTPSPTMLETCQSPALVSTLTPVLNEISLQQAPGVSY